MDGELLTSTADYVVAAFVVGLLDAVMLFALARRLPRERLLEIRGYAVATAFGVWALLWAATFWGDAWASTFALVLPEQARLILPIGLTLLYTAVAALLLRVVDHLPGPGVVWIALLGGLAMQPETLWELYDLGMLQEVPALAGVAAPALLVYGLAESILYWCMILALAPLLRLGLARLVER